MRTFQSSPDTLAFVRAELDEDGDIFVTCDRYSDRVTIGLTHKDAQAFGLYLMNLASAKSFAESLDLKIYSEGS